MNGIAAKLGATWSNTGRGVRLALLGLVIAAAATLGTRVWLQPPTSDAAPAQPATGESSAIAAGRTFLQLQDAREQRLQDKIDRVLARAFGRRAVVTINLELEPRTESRSGVNLPDSGLTPSLVESTPVSSAAVGRLRPRPDAGVHKREIDPMLYGKRVEMQLAPVIRRITVAIALDAKAWPSSAERQDAAEAVTAIVKQTVGFDPARGDELAAPVFTDFAADSTEGPSAFFGWAMTFAVLVLLLGLGCLLMLRFGTPRREHRVMHQRDLEAAIDQDPETVARLLGTWAEEARL